MNDNYSSQDFYKNEVSTLLIALPIVCFCVITKIPLARYTLPSKRDKCESDKSLN